MDHLADAHDFMAFVAASPTPHHAVAEAARRLDAAGFGEHPEGPAADRRPDSGYRRRGGALLAWRVTDPNAPVRVVCAHTDSPNLRLTPRPDVSSAGYSQFGIEVYGGALHNSWVDRDLGLAGHLAVRGEDGVEMVLVNIDRPVLRIPQLAIHLDRDVNSKGLVLNAHKHLRPVWAMSDPGDEAESVGLTQMLAAETGVAADRILAFELMVHDTAPPAIWGWRDEFVSCARIDNQLSCWAGLSALIEQAVAPNAVLALFDHEEVGSVSSTGAGSMLLADSLIELAGPSVKLDGSLCVSADCAHATNPNYADRHDPDHQILLNAGPVIKLNSNQRYATTPLAHAIFADACDRAGVEHQVFVNRADLACGSTVGPITAARTGLDTIDVGAPQWAMHSARETTGAADPHLLRRALSAVLVP